MKTSEFELLDAELVHQLLRASRQPSTADRVSMFLPLPHGAWNERPARLELKNLLAIARDQISETLGGQGADEVLRPAEAMLEDDADWSGLGGGIAFLLAPDASHLVHLPEPVGPSVMIDTVWDIASLTPLIEPDHCFGVLTLSTNDVRLYRATRYTWVELRSENLPTSLAEDRWQERHDNALSSHGGERLGSSASPSRVIHAAESWRDAKKDMIERFFHDVARFVAELLLPNEPLVLVGTERDIASFRLATEHTTILERVIAGNPALVAAGRLHQDTWAIVKAMMDDGLRTEVKHAIEADRLILDPDALLEAIDAGRVKNLILPRSSGHTSTDVPHRAGGVQSFVNHAVVATYAHRGAVSIVDPSELPAGTAVAALPRWV